jgi:hypothetical protein
MSDKHLTLRHLVAVALLTLAGSWCMQPDACQCRGQRGGLLRNLFNMNTFFSLINGGNYQAAPPVEPDCCPAEPNYESSIASEPPPVEPIYGTADDSDRLTLHNREGW